MTGGRFAATVAAPAAATRISHRYIRMTMFAALAALTAQMAVRLPYTPVPFTMQTLAVVLAGIALGPRDGFYAMCAYLGAGIMGAPVFAGMSFGPAVLFGPTGGYLFAFPAAALVSGVVFRSLGGGRPAAAAGALAGSACVLAGGTSYMMLLGGWSAAATVALSATPFLPAELLKAGAAAVLAGRRR